MQRENCKQLLHVNALPDNKKAPQLRSCFVARPGIEPRHSEPKTDVLPLYYRANFRYKLFFIGIA